MRAEPDDSRPLKICLLSYRSNPHSGGQGVYIRNLSKALVNLGHQVDVICGPPDLPLSEGVGCVKLPCLDLYNPDDLFRLPGLRELADPINLIEWLGVSTMGFPEPFTFGVRAYLYLRDKFRRYDIIHDNQCLAYGVWAMSKSAPCVATIHHPITVDRDLAVKAAPFFWQKMKHLRWYSLVGMQKRVARTLSRVITVSDCARKDIAREFKIARDRFRIVPNGVDTELFHPVPDTPREPGRIMVTNSADVPLKGLAYLLRAAARVSESREIRLIVIGEPRKNGRIVRLVRELGIGRMIRFTGRVDQAEFIRQYARASAAVVPSLYEGFGLPAIEAMACGVPVISTTGGALPEVVGDAGVLIPPADHEAMARAIASLLDDPGRARRVGRAGYERVQKYFTWEKAARATARVYREAIRDYR
ncbi:MAG: glycosyltransferase family 4 protein [Desulfobacterales bacterium]|nr:glycosyltransferase family 4 protein [Desulfobacterales bacterium]